MRSACGASLTELVSAARCWIDRSKLGNAGLRERPQQTLHGLLRNQPRIRFVLFGDDECLSDSALCGGELWVVCASFVALFN